MKYLRPGTATEEEQMMGALIFGPHGLYTCAGLLCPRWIRKLVAVLVDVERAHVTNGVVRSEFPFCPAISVSQRMCDLWDILSCNCINIYRI